MPFSSISSSSYQQNTTVQSVTEINRSIKLILENSFSFIAVSGEVSNVRRPYSGHIYFTLKDESSQLKAVLFKPQQRYLPKELTNGDKIICRGRIAVYEPRGEYQIIVDSVEFGGEGDLQLAFEQLKKKLSSEGLFDDDHKKQIPFFPRTIALITSPTSAAVHDFLKISESRFAALPIEIYPVSVQGDEAAQEITSAVLDANKKNTAEVIVICRGGGSSEDLWPFNNESLARCVFQSTLPVVSAVGHEIDFTILDFVADMRAPTPSAAAELVVPSRKNLRSVTDDLKERIAVSMSQLIKSYRQTISLQQRLLTDPTTLLQNMQLRIDHLQSSMVYSLKNKYLKQGQQLKNISHSLKVTSPQYTITDKKNQLLRLQKALINNFQHIKDLHEAKTNNATALLLAVNPKAVLKRGYSIVYNESKEQIIRSSKQVSLDDELYILTGEGAITSKVTKTS